MQNRVTEAEDETHRIIIEDTKEKLEDEQIQGL